MEGDIKDIVLARLEKRLKDKDEEIRSLKERVKDFESSDPVKALEARVGRLEAGLQEAQVALSETMKKVGAVEALIVAANCADGECEDMADPDLALDGQNEPLAPDAYRPGVAAAAPDGNKETGGEGQDKKDAMRFFRMGKNS